ncbi:helix-turn-helix domain-containing protein [Cellulosimicrobium sp. E-16]|jgi:predicted nucleotidyltransferase/DNA-binding XRE family transcriptional regulator|uniref:helix-turn-helix domain-containing protein n=1 Tax=Cellulosimicrobium sp. E-16 TaxID=3404049 RepID=UPI003CF015C3
MSTAGTIKACRERAGMSQSELAARAGTSQPAVSRYESGASSPSVKTLERLLAAAGARLELAAVPVKRRFDARTPRMAHLRAHRQEILAAARRYGATDVRIFGSVARGEDGPDSDVDVLVDLDVRRLGLLPVAHLADELSDLLDEQVDVVPVDALAPHVAESALAQAVSL